MKSLLSPLTRRLRARLPSSSRSQRATFTGIFTGKVMEFTGPGLATFAFEEQAVLSNMAVECNALTAIMEPSEPMVASISPARAFATRVLSSGIIRTSISSSFGRPRA